MENTETAVILAPAAGSGIGKLVADELLARPGFVKRMADAIDGALEANTRHWDREAKCFEIEPDYKVRLAAFMGLVAHMEGDPVKRIIHQHLGQDGKLDVAGALRDSPELAAAVRREVDKVEWRTSGRQAHKRPAKQVEAMEVEGEAGPAKGA